MTADPLLKATAVTKVFAHRGGAVEALKGVDLEVGAGEIVAVMGRSGAGKSTLLHVLGGLEAPSSGTVEVRGQDLWTLSDSRRARLRARELAFVFQAHHLLADFSALENVSLAARIGGLPPAEALERAHDWLTRFGLKDRLGHRSVELSGGECARVALARALVNGPAILLADEPTGNLDRGHAEEILSDLSREVERERGCVVIVTHDPLVTGFARRVVRLDDGRISG
jgi:lipoprotein-releasing system ATP-binding protein